MTISEQTLLEGAWWAIEQAGRLITSAVALHDAGDYSTAVVLATFSREEIGRSNILRAEGGKVAAGQTSTPAGLKTAGFAHHISKLAHGSLSVALRDDREFADIWCRLGEHPVGSPEHYMINAELKALVDAKQKAQPDDYHTFRMNALYVNLDDRGTGWKLPRKINVGEASNFVYDAAHDYGLASSELQPGVTERLHPRMAEVLTTMSEQPHLARPVYPKRHVPPT